jgi:hypothetical protein
VRPAPGEAGPGVPVPGVRLIEFVDQHPDVAPWQLANSCWPIALPGQAAAIWRMYLMLLRDSPLMSG